MSNDDYHQYLGRQSSLRKWRGEEEQQDEEAEEFLQHANVQEYGMQEQVPYGWRNGGGDTMPVQVFNICKHFARKKGMVCARIANLQGKILKCNGCIFQKRNMPFRRQYFAKLGKILKWMGRSAWISCILYVAIQPLPHSIAGCSLRNVSACRHA